MTLRDRYNSLFQFYAGRQDWNQLRAQAICESNLDPRAISPAGAEGLCQFLPNTFREIMRGHAADVFNPETSIQAQAIYMGQLLARYGNDLAQALAAYNWGMGNVDRVNRAYPDDWRAHLPDETRAYLTRIAATYATLTEGP